MQTVSWDSEQLALRVIDQRLLPAELRLLTLRQPEEVAKAITDMAVRGAPAVGVAAAFGLALAALRSAATTLPSLLGDLDQAAAMLRAARPTAVNLTWALRRLMARAAETSTAEPDAVRRALLLEAQRVAEEDVKTSRSIGQHGATLIADGDTVIHHCNTGALASVGYGTALGVLRTAHEQGKRLHVLVAETRPQLQGARLTAWELRQYGIPYEIIVDAAAGHFLRSGKVASVWVGADRIAANGDVANKIGTYMLALAAHASGVPFYVAAPSSSIDLGTPNGEAIPIEERPPEEVLDLQLHGRPVAPAGSSARNPAFDVTPAHLLSAIVTEFGVLRPPFEISLQQTRREARP